MVELRCLMLLVTEEVIIRAEIRRIERRGERPPAFL